MAAQARLLWNQTQKYRRLEHLYLCSNLEANSQSLSTNPDFSFIFLHSVVLSFIYTRRQPLHRNESLTESEWFLTVSKYIPRLDLWTLSDCMNVLLQCHSSLTGRFLKILKNSYQSCENTCLSDNARDKFMTGPFSKDLVTGVTNCPI